MLTYELQYIYIHGWIVFTVGGGGGTGGPDPPEKSQNIGFPSNTGQDPIKSTRLPGQHSISGHHRHASEMAFRWQADDGPLVVVFGSSLPSLTTT